MLNQQPHRRDPEWSKLDPRTRFDLETGRLGDSMEALARSSGPLSAAQKDELSKLGVSVRTEIGEIFTCTIPTDKLQDVLKLKYIQQVEGSRPLYAD